jgi:hypothetical protein
MVAATAVLCFALNVGAFVLGVGGFFGQWGLPVYFASFPAMWCLMELASVLERKTS